jgi:hypothetical protein
MEVKLYVLNNGFEIGGVVNFTMFYLFFWGNSLLSGGFQNNPGCLI